VAQRLGSVPPSPRTVKSDPLRFWEERCLDFGDRPSSAQRRWTLSHTSGAVKFPPLSSAATRSLDFVQVHGSEVLGRPWRNEGRIYHTPLGLSNPCHRALTILRHFGFVRCSPVHGATRREFTTPRWGCQIHAIMLLRSCGISVLSGARPSTAQRGPTIPPSRDPVKPGWGRSLMPPMHTVSGQMRFDSGRRQRWARLPV